MKFAIINHRGEPLLRKEDQTIISVPIARLSEKDRGWAAFLSESKGLLDGLRSEQQAVRVDAAKSLAARDIPEGAVPAILEFISLEIAELPGNRPREKRLPIKSVPFMGNETRLVRIKADSQSYRGQTFLLVGSVEPSSYYNFGYDDAESTFFALRLREIDKAAKWTGETVHLYVPRTFSHFLVDRIVRSKEEGASGLLVRAKATIDPARYEGAASWDLMEMVDWQFLDPKKNEWKPWALEGLALGLALLAKLNEVEALLNLVSAEVSHGPEAVDDYVRVIAAQKLREVEVNRSQVRFFVDMVTSDSLHGSKTADAFVRNAAIETLAKLSRNVRLAAIPMLRKAYHQAKNSKKESAAKWASQAAQRLRSSDRKSR